MRPNMVETDAVRRVNIDKMILTLVLYRVKNCNVNSSKIK